MILKSIKIIPWFSALVLTLLLSQYSFAQTSQKATAKNVVGDVQMQKGARGSWKPVKVGAKIRHQDRIRTFADANVEILFSTGTILTIEENSVVSMKELLEKGESKTSTISVKKGNVLFNIKKLTSAKSKFKFESVTATAAIRGTSGGFGLMKSGSVIYLTTGALHLKSASGQAFRIKSNQIAIAAGGTFKVHKFKNTKGLTNVLKKLASIEKKLTELPQGEVLPEESLGLNSLFNNLPDSLQGEVVEALDSLEALQMNLDSAFVEPPEVLETALVDSTLKDSINLGVSASFASIGTYKTEIDVPELMLQGTCPSGGVVTVGALSVVSKEGKWSLILRWPEHEEGPRNFIAKCVLGSKVHDLGKVSFNYIRPVEEFKLELLTAKTVKVTSGKITVKGTYSGKDTRLILTAGQRSVELTNPAKTFSYDFMVSDAARTWDIKELRVKLKSPQGEIVETISIEADRTAKGVNTQPALITASIDDLKGIIRANVTQIDGDAVKIRYSVNGDVFEEFESSVNVVGRALNLEPGDNKYEIEATDLAGNVTLKTFAVISYWPRVEFVVSLISPTQSGKIRVPPMPPGRVEKLRELFDIRIRNLPEDNPAYIKEIVVINAAANFRHVLRQSQINDVNFNIDIPLERGLQNKIIVRVTPQQGPVKEVNKVIEIIR